MLRTVSARNSPGECGIDRHLLAERSLARFRRPVLAEGDEELLVAGETILHRRRLAGKRGAISVIGSRDTRYVRDILRERLLTIE